MDTLVMMLIQKVWENNNSNIHESSTNNNATCDLFPHSTQLQSIYKTREV